MTPRRALLAGAAGFGMTHPLARPAPAQPRWAPERPLRLVVPFPPGGPTDLVARPLAQRLGEALGQPIVVDNRGGAGGNLGADAVAKAPPDGHTLLLSNVGILAVNRFLYRGLPFDPERDFAPVALVAGAPVALVVRAELPTRSVAEFVAWTRAQPGPVPYGSAGPGSPGHLAGEVFRSLTGAALAHLPYRGSAPALQDLAAGHIPAMFDPVQSPLAQIQAGRVRALAISAAARSPALPEVPTMAEAGVPGHAMVAWWAVVAPAGTPAPVLARLAEAILGVTAAPDWQAGMTRQGISPMPLGPEALAGFLRAEAERWGAAVRQSGATAE
jgi:tripartite-type tricarboxylate transporter receptor subunit TctC